jgi:hypothetical protein
MKVQQSEGMPRRRTRAEVEKLVSEYEASGLRRQAFCDKHGLSLSTLSRHRKGKQLRSEKIPASGLIPVQVLETRESPARQECGELLVWLSGGRRIEVRGGIDLNVLEQLVRVLEQA